MTSQTGAQYVQAVKENNVVGLIRLGNAAEHAQRMIYTAINFPEVPLSMLHYLITTYRSLLTGKMVKAAYVQGNWKAAFALMHEVPTWRPSEDLIAYAIDTFSPRVLKILIKRKKCGLEELKLCIQTHACARPENLLVLVQRCKQICNNRIRVMSPHYNLMPQHEIQHMITEKHNAMFQELALLGTGKVL